MTPAASVPESSQEELLREAIARRLPLALSCRVSDGWAGFYSKFLQMGQAEHELLVEYPWCDGMYVPELVPGQTLGISFRRGPKRCVFSSKLIATRRISLKGTEIPAILIEWPEQVFELQRRLDYRAPAPTERTIEVTARRQLQAWMPPEPVTHATLNDISAGGLSMDFPASDHPQWDCDEVIHCTFTPDPQQEPFDLIGRVRYAQQMRDAFRIGLQWHGLEATDTGRQLLDRIIDLCADYQRIEMSRLGLLNTPNT